MARIYALDPATQALPEGAKATLAAELGDPSTVPGAAVAAAATTAAGPAAVTATGATGSDANHTTRIDAKTGRTGLFVRNEQQKYAVKVDQYDTNGAHDAVNIAANFPGAHTALGIISGNTEFSTVKVTNTAAQTGGAIFAAVGDNTARTAGLFGGDNSGKGPSFVSSMKAGGDGVAFRAAYDPGVYSTAAFWATCHHSGGDLVKVENDGAHTSGAMLRLVQSNAAATTPGVWIENAGTGESITAPNFNVLKDGRVKLGQIESSSGFANGTVKMQSTGALIERAANDANPVLKVRDNSTSGTGDLAQFIKRGGTTVAKVTPAGDVEFLVSGIGVVLRSPAGTRYRLGVTDDGALTTTTL